MAKNFLFIACLLLACPAMAQEAIADSLTVVPVVIPDFYTTLSEGEIDSEGRIILLGEVDIPKLLKLEVAVNQRSSSFSGYRIQLLSVPSYRSDIDSLKRYCTAFEENFPDVPAYLQYLDPDFKVRVGNFKSKLEAIPTLKKIRRKYPSSYIVKTPIYQKELRRDEMCEASGEENTTMESIP